MNAWVSAVQVKGRPSCSGLSDDNAALVAQAATDILGPLTGDLYGVTTRTVRPEGCGEGRRSGWSIEDSIVGWGLPLVLGSYIGPWPLPGPAGGMASLCCDSCDQWSIGAIRLDGPVVWDTDNPISILVDGTALDPGKWSIVAGHTLVRTDGGVFPQCQDIRVATTEVGTCAVTYSAGVAVPMAGQQACISLAAQLALAWKLSGASGACELPQRVTSIARQGVTVGAIMDSMDILQKGGTGLSDVDMFINAVNPTHRRGPSVVLGPNFGRRMPTVFPGTSGAFT